MTIDTNARILHPKDINNKGNNVRIHPITGDSLYSSDVGMVHIYIWINLVYSETDNFKSISLQVK